MASRIKQLRTSLKWIGFYIPFTLYCALFILTCFLGYSWLQTKAGIPDSAYKDIFSLLLRFTAGFCIILLSIAFITAFIPLVYFLIKKNKQRISFEINTPAKAEKTSAGQPIVIRLLPVLKPLLGFVKIRLKYGPDHFSEKFTLIDASSKKLFSNELNGTYYWRLPEIREYKIDKAVIFFEDFFQFFSFAIPLNTKNNFHTYPVASRTEGIAAFPRKTEETSIRIEEIKKVEGEHINYKNFESNDDVRRIVWKIYAKNKELVVRIPEVMDPYASHLYLYASFFSSFDIRDNEVINSPFLNYYKTICWSVYKQFAAKGFDVKYIPDQDIPQNRMENDEEQTRYAISVSSWHTEKQLRDHVKAKDASLVIISSLSNPEQVKHLLEGSGSEITFVFVPLTEGLSKQHLGDWLQWLFVQQEKDSTAVHKSAWSLSLLRLKIIKNEKQLKQLLDMHERSAILHKTLQGK
ncbi:MAG TPA: DUF58 domain-containing protein [Bacteroidia bacterium]|jgi:hypothetical protein